MNTIHVGQLQHPTFAAVGCSLTALLFVRSAHYLHPINPDGRPVTVIGSAHDRCAQTRHLGVGDGGAWRSAASLAHAYTVAA